MHNLETRIRDWRRQMKQALGNQRDLLDELESHLREELEQQLAPSIDQAWNAALAKLGDPQALAAEFAKAHPPARWLPARLAWYAWAALALAIIAWAPRLLASGDALLAVHVLFAMTGYVSTLLLGALGACFALERPFLEWDSSRSRAMRRVALPLAVFAGVCTLVAAYLGAEWAKRSWNAFWSWDSKEVGALTVICGNLLLGVLLLWKRIHDRWLMGLTLLNNVLVTLAWFHPLLGIGWNGSLHSYGWSAYGSLVIAFLLVQGLLAAMTTLPPEWLRPRRASE